MIFLIRSKLSFVLEEDGGDDVGVAKESKENVENQPRTSKGSKGKKVGGGEKFEDVLRP